MDGIKKRGGKFAEEIDIVHKKLKQINAKMKCNKAKKTSPEDQKKYDVRFCMGLQFIYIAKLFRD